MYEPVQAVLIWPAAGIGIAAALVWGIRVLPALYLAELAISLLFYQNPDYPITTASLIKSNAFILAGVMRSYLGAYLIRYMIGYPNSFISYKPIIKFYLIVAPLTTFLSTLVYTFIKYLFNYISTTNFIDNFISWWFGDLLGFILFVPLTMLFIAQPKSIWKARRLSIGLPIIILFLSTILLYNKSIVSENEDIANKLNLKNEIVTTNISIKLNWLAQFNKKLQAKAQEPTISQTEFINFLRQNAQHYPLLDAVTISWNKNHDFLAFSPKKTASIQKLVATQRQDKSFFYIPKDRQFSPTLYDNNSDTFSNRILLSSHGNKIELVIYHHLTTFISTQFKKYSIDNSNINLSIPFKDQQIELASSHFKLPEKTPPSKKKIHIMQEEWQLSIQPTTEYLIRNHSYSSTLIAKTSFIFTGLISIMLMILTGKTVLNQIKIKDRTLELDIQAKKLKSSKEQYQDLVEHHPVILWRQNLASQKMSYMSKKVEKVFGYPLMNWLNIKDFWLSRIHSADQQKVKNIIQQAIKNQESFALQYKIIKADKSIAWIKDVVNVVIEDGSVTELVGLMIDNSSEEQALQKSALVESKYQTLFQYSVDPLLILNLDDFSVKDVNDKAKNIFGEKVKQKHILLAEFAPKKQADGSRSEKFLSKILKKFSHLNRLDFEFLMFDKNQQAMICQIEMVKLPEEFTNSALVNINDITEKKRHEKKINKLAYYDTLTGLPNRQYFYSKFEYFHKRAIENKLYGCLIYLDLDRFKILNDSKGHQTGDQLLKKVGNRIQKTSKKKNFCARLAGDEFIILTKNLQDSIESTLEKSLTLAESILDSLNEPYQLDDYEHFITPSIGIAVFPAEHNSLDQIIHQADIAMYTSKNRGKNTITVYQNSMMEHVQSKLRLEKAIKQAFEYNEFELLYQAQYNEKHQINSVEALLRWDKLYDFSITTEELITTIETMGLIHELGFWVFDKACWQLEQWNKQNSTVKTIAINVSAKQFHEKLFTEQIKSIIDNYDIRPKQVCIELTEAVIAKDLGVLVSKLNELKAFGVKVSLDDFGTGYSSLAYLKYLPIDQLKIDKLFVHDLHVGKTAQFIIKTIIDLASSLHLDLVAEGIETKQQFEILLQLGCKKFQGFYFSTALSADKL